ncbi:MAG: bifunctional folylpolyglutamate synthase/dihydrofolate synthase, partial [Bdellovibrionales bacterium]
MHAQGHIEERLYSITERLSALFPKKIDLSLGRIERFLGQLGNPHLDIPPAIHVAGTNGKGSSIAFLRSCLEHLGYTCHAMTSPHLVRFNERIILAGEEISTDHYMTLLDECERVNAGEQISYFEMVIATTFLAFSRTEADYSLVETGLGGRLDATNVVPDPRATLITTISFDHMDYLGDSLTKIASEKAGIMK